MPSRKALPTYILREFHSTNSTHELRRRWNRLFLQVRLFPYNHISTRYSHLKNKFNRWKEVPHHYFKKCRITFNSGKPDRCMGPYKVPSCTRVMYHLYLEWPVVLSYQGWEVRGGQESQVGAFYPGVFCYCQGEHVNKTSRGLHTCLGLRGYRQAWGRRETPSRWHKIIVTKGKGGRQVLEPQKHTERDVSTSPK